MMAIEAVYEDKDYVHGRSFTEQRVYLVLSAFVSPTSHRLTRRLPRGWHVLRFAGLLRFMFDQTPDLVDEV